MMGKMGNNDMFKNMMGQMNPEEMRQNTVPETEEPVQEQEPELSREENSKRLKEKIAEKRKNR